LGSYGKSESEEEKFAALPRRQIIFGDRYIPSTFVRLPQGIRFFGLKKYRLPGHFARS
jgi:hypothetical protein